MFILSGPGRTGIDVATAAMRRKLEELFGASIWIGYANMSLVRS